MRRRGICVGLLVLALGACASEPTADDADAPRTEVARERPAHSTAAPPAEQRIEFTGSVRDLGVPGAVPDTVRMGDTVRIVLTGRVHDTPIDIRPVRRENAGWDTPLDAVRSDYSAWIADDSEWILSNFAPQDRPAIRRMLADPGQRAANLNVLRRTGLLSIAGRVTRGRYVILWAERAGASQPFPLIFTLVRTDAGWKRTNDLSGDPIFDVIWAAFRSDGRVRLIDSD